MNNEPAEIIVIDFSTKGGIYQDSANRLIISGSWEHVAFRPEVRDAISKAIQEALLPFADGNGKVKAKYVSYRK